MNKSEKKRTLCVGLEHFIDKIGYQSDIYKKNGEKIRYLVEDTSGSSLYYANKYNADVVILKRNVVLRFIQTLWEIFLYRPTAIEIYLSNLPKFWDRLLAPLSKILRIRLILFLRGQEFRSRYRRNRLKVLYPSLDIIIAKEMNLIMNACQMGFLPKLRFLHNCIPINDSRIPDYLERKIDILFFNSPRKERNVIFLVDVLFKLLKIHKLKLNIVMAGFNVLDDNGYKIETSYQNKVLDKIQDLGLDSNIRILGFVNNGKELFMQSKVFIFPANVVFCNYSLLEAMSFGCVPIVADGEGSYWIVNDANGYVSKLDIDCFTNAIVDALNISNWQPRSNNAILTVKKHFSIEDWYESLEKIKNV